jgi:hypothetical protein
MVQKPLKIKPPITLKMDGSLYAKLQSHLFPGDDDEHGAVIVAGMSVTSSGTTLLARDIFLAEDGVDYVSSTRGAYKALTAKFVAETADYCGDEKLCYLAVHCHGGLDSVAFS